MGIPVLVLGKSGSGKTTSLRFFAPKDVGVINVLGKSLPFKSDLKPVTVSNYAKVKQILVASKVKSIVIDDAGYLITNQFMSGHGAGKGNAVFELYNSMADNFWNLIRSVQMDLPDDKIVYFLMHEDKNDYGEIKPKTIGKMLDEKVCVEGLFSIVLRSMKIDGRYVIKTQTDGLDVTKTPMGMFDKEEIENDLKFVDNAIREYYNFEGDETNEDN